jgi:ribosomal-protein-alanine N-acetyltransferase
MLETALLRTDRLCLRPPRLDDAPIVAALMTPAVSQWLARWPVPFTLEMAKARIARSLDATAAGRALICVVEHRGECVGWIGGGRIDETDRLSFGYWLGDACHGRGFMLEAAPAYVAALHDRLTPHSIEATCHPENRGSARVLAACGLNRVGTRTEHVPARNRDELLDTWERTWTRDAPG